MNIFIPIKQNSQRVPGKNFREFNGLPLYQYVIDNILKAEKVSKIFIDTDSKEILYFYKNHEKVYAYQRVESLIGDTVSVCDLIEHCITQNALHDEWILQLHVTTPLLKPETIDSICNKVLNADDYDSIVSCNKIQSRLWREEEYGYCPVNHNPMKLEQTQDLPTLYEENSAFYAFDCREFLKTKNRVGTKPYFYGIKFPENVDIDIEADWEMLHKIKLD
jgi:CMP-N-acetylneuraminic acid synthetase